MSAASDTLLLEARGLKKSYSGRAVVDGVTLRCARAQVLGLLGPNGAGKTTTLRMLYGFVRPEGGTIAYEGKSFESDRTAIKRVIGVCTQDDTLDYDFTVVQNLRMYGRYFSPRIDALDVRIAELLERFHLTKYAHHSPRTLSGGFKRRLLLARSVVHRPRILFLDEPTTGLDPQARVAVWELIHAMREEGMGIVLTTHYMDEAERLSDRLLVLSRGRSVAEGTPSDVLGSLLGEHVIVVKASDPTRDAIATWVEEHTGAPPSWVLGELHAALTNEELARLSDRFGSSRFVVREPTLDDLFLKLSVEVAEGENA